MFAQLPRMFLNGLFVRSKAAATREEKQEMSKAERAERRLQRKPRQQGERGRGADGCDKGPRPRQNFWHLSGARSNANRIKQQAQSDMGREKIR